MATCGCSWCSCQAKGGASSNGTQRMLMLLDVHCTQPAGQQDSCRARGFQVGMSAFGMQPAGMPGFVEVMPDGCSLRWPDYVGNNMFQTLVRRPSRPACF